MFNGLRSALAENLIFVVEFLLIIAALFAVAYLVEKKKAIWEKFFQQG